MNEPRSRPNNPNFSCGPTAKRPNWNINALIPALVGRSHRSKEGKAKLKEVITKSKKILEIPDDYLVGIVPGSDTGAFEMAMWTMLGERGVDGFAWENFGYVWLVDLEQELKLKDLRIFKADYGKLPDMKAADPKRDIIFTWNGTSSGVIVPDANWISDDREGLTFCDAVSSIFSVELPWKKLDVVTFSWQKSMGSEAAHGMIVLSPRAVKRLETYTPSWPIPKLFRLTKNNKLIDGIFEGETINTPSLLCVEDALDSLNWMEKAGGLSKLVERTNENLQVVKEWLKSNDWMGFLAEDPNTISPTAICLKVVDPWYKAKSLEEQTEIMAKVVNMIEAKKVAYDIKHYRDAPPGIRIWSGCNIESYDIEMLLPWVKWAYDEVKQSV